MTWNDLGVGQKFCLADFRATHAILPRSSRLWTQPKSCRPHARGVDFGSRSTHAILRGSRMVWKCWGRADLGRGRDVFDPRNVAWVEQNLAPARFVPTLGSGQVWPRTDFEGCTAKWFWAITCTIWLRFEFRGLGSAWFFSAHLLFFHARGLIFEPQIRFVDLGSTFWPGDLLGVRLGCRKTYFCDEILLSWQFRGFPVTQMNSIVHRTHLGRLHFPKP